MPAELVVEDLDLIDRFSIFHFKFFIGGFNLQVEHHVVIEIQVVIEIWYSFVRQ